MAMMLKTSFTTGSEKSKSDFYSQFSIYEVYGVKWLFLISLLIPKCTPLDKTMYNTAKYVTSDHYKDREKNSDMPKAHTEVPRVNVQIWL